MKKFALTAFAALAMFLSTDAMAQKIAIIDSKIILDSHPEAVAAVQKLQGIQKVWTDSLSMMRTALKTKFETYSSMLDQLSEEKKKSANQELETMQEGIARFEQVKFGQQGELAQQQAALVRPILEKIQQAVAGFAKREKYSVVLDRQNVIYFDSAVDVTEKFAAYLRNGK
jgi:outer membrane protein